MDQMKLKNLSIRPEIHAEVARLAKLKGMTIQRLTEIIVRDWMTEHVFFENECSSSNNATNDSLQEASAK